VAGIVAGADDYLRKPFAFAELEARLQAIARRVGGEPQVDVLRIGELALDLGARVARLTNEPIAFTARELAFLEVFEAPLRCLSSSCQTVVSSCSRCGSR